MRLYKKIKRAYAIELADLHFVPDEYYTDWVDDDSVSDEALLDKIRAAHGYSTSFSYGIEHNYVPYVEVYKIEQNDEVIE